MLRILLIDDNPDDRFLVTRQLQQEFSSISVTSIIDVKSFEKALALGNFDIAITDYRLLWSNGLVVLKAIKAQSPNCPVIMYTDSGNEEIAVVAMKSGLSDYVIKGNLQLLAIAIRESLAKRTLLQEYTAAIEQLQMSEQRLRLAMNAADMGTWDWDMVTEQVVWSENHERLFGLPSGSFLGSYQAFLSCVHPKDRENIDQAVSFALKTQTEYNNEFRVIWSDGTIRWILGKGNFIYNDIGKPTRMIGVVLDITERKRREEELEQANRLKDEFLAIVSHELRTPLNAILGWAQLLRSRNFDEATRNQSLEIIERSAIQQNQLINDILDTSRLVQGQMHLNVSAVNLVRVIENSLDTVRLSAEAKCIKLETKLDPSITVVMGDENRLQQIFWNLLSNAIKFTSIGGRVLIKLERVQSCHASAADTSRVSATSDEAYMSQSNPPYFNVALPTLENTVKIRGSSSSSASESHSVSMTQSQATSYAQITVSDNGEGITPEFLPYVFDRFRQADSTMTRSSSGLGLGLAIVRQLVELHGGTVTAESQGKGQGATFTVKLPLLVVNTQEPKVILADNYQNSQLQSLQILVVENDTDTLELLVEILQDTGAEVIAVTSASAALEILAELKPDVLISDIGMPQTNGYTLIHQVRKNLGKTQNLPAIALTAYSREEDKIQALEAGFQIFLPKPVNSEELVATISNLVYGTRT
jgi:PAS domain S-box-containing protein